jgi:hypothetical protein
VKLHFKSSADSLSFDIAGRMLNGILKSAGCTTEELGGIYSVIAGPLCFGNIQFEDEDTAEGSVAVAKKEARSLSPR